MTYRFQFRDVWAQWEALADGVLFTLFLSGVTMATGLAIGCLAAAARLYGPRPVALAVATYVEVFRNTPLLVQLFLVFFGLPGLGIKFDATTAALLTLSINLGAYTAEIVRAGLQAIPRSQIEAGYSLGLSGLQVFRYVIFLPALKIVYPSLTSQFVLLMLATSVVSQIAAADLFHAASIIQSRTFRDFEIYAVVAIVYLALAFGFRAAFAGVHLLLFRRR